MAVRKGEEVGQTFFPKIKVARGPRREWSTLAQKLEELEATLYVNGSNTIRTKIAEIVPEYFYPCDTESKANVDEEPWLTAGRGKIA